MKVIPGLAVGRDSPAYENRGATSEGCGGGVQERSGGGGVVDLKGEEERARAEPRAGTLPPRSVLAAGRYWNRGMYLSGNSLSISSKRFCCASQASWPWYTPSEGPAQQGRRHSQTGHPLLFFAATLFESNFYLSVSLLIE